MIRNFFIFGIIVFIIGIVITYWVSCHSVSFLQLSCNNVFLGNILQNHEGTADIILKNVGPETIRITNVKYTCGCTQYSLDRRILETGQSAKLHLSVNAENTEGKFKVKLMLFWSSLDAKIEGKETIQVRGISDSVLRLSQKFIELSYVSSDSPSVTEHISITPGTSDLKWDNLKVISQAGAYAKVQCIGNNQWVLNYSVFPKKLPVGVYHDSIFITPEKKGRLIEGGVQIPVNGSIESDFDLSPRTLYLGRLSSSNLRVGTVKIKMLDQKSIKYISEISPKYLKVEVLEKIINL